MKINYQKLLDETINEIKKNKIKPGLLLHSCCAPCSSYVLEYLSGFFNITIYYYNPNIYPEDEFVRRRDEQIKFIKDFFPDGGIDYFVEDYSKDDFYSAIKGLEDEDEGGKRCFECYRIRLNKAAEYGVEKNIEYFTTTLSISPHKDSQWINEIGKKISTEKNIKFLFSDFKKNEGYKRSLELSKLYNLYRQDYCGCVFSNKNYKK